MELYHYNSDGYLVYVSTAADISTGIPPSCTTVAPAPAQPGKIQKWSATMGTWVQVDKPAAVPNEVSMWKAKSILEAQGFLPDIEKAINAMPGDDGIVARQKWAHATVVSRTDILVSSMQAAFGWSDAVIDGMFVAAYNIK